MAAVNLVGCLSALINDARKKEKNPQTNVATIKRLLQAQTLALRQPERNLLTNLSAGQTVWRLAPTHTRVCVFIYK